MNDTPFRAQTPKRRPNRAECVHYTSYRDTLKEDFNSRCGYCDDPDSLRIRSFAIDHFVPRNPTTFKHDIADNYYYNLVYACSFCNGAKSNKWFTNNSDDHHTGKIGFIDPTDLNYTNIFRRNKSGEICPNGQMEVLAQNIIKELKLWYPIHAITWKLEKLLNLEKKVRAIIENKLTNDQDQSKWDEVKQVHYEILLQVTNLYEKIFKENG